MVPWRSSKLGDVARVQSGAQVGRNGIKDPVCLPYLRVANVQDGFLDLREIKTIRVSAREVERFRLIPGDILMTEGGDADKLGRGHIWRGEIEPCLHQNHIFAVRVDRARLLPEFLAAYLTTPEGRLYFRRAAKQTTNLATINSSQLRAMPLLLPGIDEQDAIVRRVGNAESAVRAAEALIERKVAYKKALAEDLLTGRRRFPGFPTPWREFTLGDLFVERVDPGRKGLRLLSVTGADGVVDRDSLIKRDTSSEDKSKYLRVCPGDIAYNTMRMWQGVFGLSTLEGIVSPAYTVCTPISELILPQFIEQFFKLPHTINDFKRYSQGLVDDTLNLKFHHFALIKVTIPGTDEQHRIADLLGAIDAEIALLRKQREALNEQKRGLMQKLLTGEVRLKEFR